MLRVQEISGRGRGVLASRHIKAGEEILRESPFLVYPNSHSNSSQEPSSFCGCCYRALEHQKQQQYPRCQSCGVPPLYFCSSECQSLSSNTNHTPWVCSATNILRSYPMHPDLQEHAHFLIAAYNLSVVDPCGFQKLMALHGEASAASQEAAEAETVHSFIVSSMAAWPPQALQIASPHLTATLLAKDRQNAYGLMAPFQPSQERQVRAYGFYAFASFFNHDCLPNACRYDYVDKPGKGNTDIIIRALHDISEGSEICLSYFPVNWPYADRQRRLHEEYGFVCKCDRCNVEETWSETASMDASEGDMEEDAAEMEGENIVEENDDDFPHAYFFVRYICPVDHCGGTMAPLPPDSGIPSSIMECNACGLMRSDEELDKDIPIMPNDKIVLKDCRPNGKNSMEK